MCDTIARLACAQIKGMKDRDLARLWAQYVRELAVLLVRAEGGDPTPEVAARVQELVHRELLLLYIRCARTLCMWGNLLSYSHVGLHRCWLRAHTVHVPKADQNPPFCVSS